MQLLTVRKCLSIVVLSAALCGFSQNFVASSEEKKIDLQDVDYNFSSEKVSQADDTFHFIRAFVDYFYLLVSENKSVLTPYQKLSAFSGQCVGDAHAENFGFLIQADGSSKFTMNDVDDFGPCPVALDLFRFLVSSSAYDPDLDIKAILDYYVRGLQGESVASPSGLKDLRKMSLQNGTGINLKKVDGGKFVRNDSTSEVLPQELSPLSFYIRQTFGVSSILDAIKTSKKSGGSGGLERYQVLFNEGTALRHLEFKQQVRPSIYPVAVGPLPSLEKKVLSAIGIEQGPGASKFYGYAKINSLDTYVRPMFLGNASVSLSKQPQPETQDILNYEVYTLGTIHRQSVIEMDAYISALKGIRDQEWSSQTRLVAEFLNRKFKSLQKVK